MKTKLIIVAIMSLSVVGLVGVYINQLLHLSDRQPIKELLGFPVNSQIVTPSLDMGKIENNNLLRAPQKLNTNSNHLMAPKVSSNQPFEYSKGSRATSQVSSTVLSSGGSNLFAQSTDKEIYSGGVTSGSGSSLLVGSKKSSHHSSSVGGGISNSAVGNKNAVSAPFFAPRPGSSSNTVIIDPGTDPDPDTRIPVGNGMGLLLIFGGLYGIYLMKRKQVL